MTVGSTFAVAPLAITFADIRCHNCKRLLFRWEFRGRATIEVKCPRCGSKDLLALSTG